ncbi:MAG: hypothetical protein BWY57_03103 [Betaproteobacteria bacterium ADurb.Bin341]|nr:MAG: hypothetical protein BWY57_03103 [Betaproteobacteria bacterium ADurb.Bin341]
MKDRIQRAVGNVDGKILRRHSIDCRLHDCGLVDFHSCAVSGDSVHACADRRSCAAEYNFTKTAHQEVLFNDSRVVGLDPFAGSGIPQNRFYVLREKALTDFF